RRPPPARAASRRWRGGPPRAPPPAPAAPSPRSRPPPWSSPAGSSLLQSHELVRVHHRGRGGAAKELRHLARVVSLDPVQLAVAEGDDPPRPLHPGRIQDGYQVPGLELPDDPDHPLRKEA